jgi:hypothetical protein
MAHSLPNPQQTRDTFAIPQEEDYSYYTKVGYWNTPRGNPPLLASGETQ